MLVDKLPVETERYATQGKQVEEVDHGGNRPAGAEKNNKKVERYDAVPIEEISRQIEQSDQHFTHKLGQGNVEEDARVGLENRHVKHKESERQQEVDIVYQQGCILGIVSHNVGLKDEEEDGDDSEAYERQDKRPPKEAVVAMRWVFEAGVETENGGIGPQLSQTRKEHGCIHHHTGETNLLLRQQVGDDKKGCHRPD